MNPIGHNTKTPSTATGLRAMLTGPHHSKGSGTSKIARPRTALAATLATTAFLALGAGSAQAAIYHPFLSSFTGEETPQKKVAASDLAVDGSGSVSAGDVYEVANNTAVDKFTAAGKYICQITGAGSASKSPSECDKSKTENPAVPGGQFGTLEAATVDAANGDLYVVDQGNNNVVDRFGPEGKYEEPITGLSRPEGVAVSSLTGDVYISEAGDVKKYDPVTKSISTFATGTVVEGSEVPFAGVAGVAVDNSAVGSGAVYVAETATDTVDKFSELGVYEGQLTGVPAGLAGEGPFHLVFRVAVDPASGDVYASDWRGSGVDEFGPSGVFLGQITAPPGVSEFEPFAAAVAPGGDVYVGDTHNLAVDVYGPGVTIPDAVTGAASGLGTTSATVAGTVNPEGTALTSCEFEYGTSTSYGQSAPCEYEYAPGKTTTNAGEIPVTGETKVTAQLAGLEPNATYHYRLTAQNANGYPAFGKDATFPTLPVPTIDSATVTALGLTSATLNARIDPNGLPLTKCYFEYGTSLSYGSTAQCEPGAAAIPGDSADHAVSATLPLPEEHATYHWRIVVTDANGTALASGIDHTFVYDTSGGGLPDGRRYEMVSPPRKNGALLGDVSQYGLPAGIAADGDTVITESIQCFAGAQSCSAGRGGEVGTPYEFSRGAAGWQATALVPPANQLEGSRPGGYSAGEGDALFSAPAPGAEKQPAIYVRTPSGAFADVGPAAPAGAGVEASMVDVYQSAGFAADPADGITVWSGLDSWNFAPQPNAGNTLFEYHGVDNTQPSLVAVSGGEGSTSLISACESNPGWRKGIAPGAVSKDGRIVFFEAQQCEQGGTEANKDVEVPVGTLYARVDDAEPSAETVDISEPAANAACSEPECLANTGSEHHSQFREGVFKGASEDGSRVFFMSAQQLTNAGSQDKGANLYEYVLAGAAGRKLVDVSEAEGGGQVAGGPRVEGVTAVSADGSRVYYVAGGVLTGEPNSQGQVAVEGANNLYVFDALTGTNTFIASLPGSDHVDWENPGGPANVTPDGRYLVFRSRGHLTPDDTSASAAEQIYRYDAGSGAAGTLTRISVTNEGFNDDGNRSSATPCENTSSCSEDANIAIGFLVEPLGGGRRDPTMSDNGEYVFFDSPVGLTPQALDDAPIGTKPNGQPIYAMNVYEWHNGQVSLISGGRDVSQDEGQSPACEGIGSYQFQSSVCLLGSDASGHNVFFTTADRLVPRDTDTELDIYDARICEPGDPCIESSAAPQPCLGEACHGVPAAELSAQTGGSLTFNGEGNIAPSAPKQVTKKTVKCKRGYLKKKTKCVKRHKAKRRKQAKKSTRNRGRKS